MQQSRTRSLKKQFHFITHFLFKSTIYKGNLAGPTKPGVRRHSGYLCMLQAFFSIENTPRTFNALLMAYKRTSCIACIAFCIL